MQSNSSIFKQDNQKEKNLTTKTLSAEVPGWTPIPANPVRVQRKATPASVFQARSNFLKDQKAFEPRNLAQPITGDRQLPSGILT